MVIKIITVILQIVLLFIAGYAFGSCIAIQKELNDLSDNIIKLSNIIDRTFKLNEEIICHNKDILKHDENLIVTITKYLIFIKQYMIRRKNPITKD